MKTLIALTLAGLFACGTAFAADTKAPDTKAADAKMTPQQEKMKTCNADATGKTGDERKAFMKTCLSAKPAKAGKQDGDVQQENRRHESRRARQSAKRVHEGLTAFAKLGRVTSCPPGRTDEAAPEQSGRRLVLSGARPVASAIRTTYAASTRALMEAWPKRSTHPSNLRFEEIAMKSLYLAALIGLFACQAALCSRRSRRTEGQDAVDREECRHQCRGGPGDQADTDVAAGPDADVQQAGDRQERRGAQDVHEILPDHAQILTGPAGAGRHLAVLSARRLPRHRTTFAASRLLADEQALQIVAFRES